MTTTPALTRDLLSRHGACRMQGKSDWGGPFELPCAIFSFYSEVGPENVSVEGYGNSTTFPSLKRLWGLQAGYRWNGITKKPIEGWPSNWLVIADEGADPYIFDIETDRILFAQHGTAEWSADEIYPDIFTMAACVATLGCVILDSDNFVNEDCEINSNCRVDAINRLKKILGDTNAAESIIETAGWG